MPGLGLNCSDCRKGGKICATQVQCSYWKFGLSVVKFVSHTKSISVLSGLEITEERFDFREASSTAFWLSTVFHTTGMRRPDLSMLGRRGGIGARWPGGAGGGLSVWLDLNRLTVTELAPDSCSHAIGRFPDWNFVPRSNKGRLRAMSISLTQRE